MGSLLPGDLFKGKLIRLTAARPEDDEAYARWSTDAEYLRLLNFDPARPRPIQDFKENEKEREHERQNEYRSFEFRVRTLEDDKLIGFVHLWVQWSHQTAWVGIGIGEPEYRGKGYGSDAMRAIVAYGFRELNLYRISLGVFSYNKRAIRAYEKCGFVHEGAERGALYRDGQRHDCLFMGILRPEWEAQQAAQLAAAEQR